MNNNYGKIFLLFGAIGLILLATSGKGLAVWNLLSGKTPTGGIGDTVKPPPTIQDYDKGNSGSGGVTA